ncbi:ABC transporter permease [Methanobrevibacter sp.]|uniref:ABC transporter permease n=1 Tax=Methanobrevibacter sp. TaxID=66852 RepID=UPI0026E0C133|nr:ABC transporter permease [Methanobrevibacter sp.]MDO5860577.1 ABC transporter permease [Methanobrevibacter sp.]
MKKFKEEYTREMLILPIIIVIIWYLICDFFQLVPSYAFPGPIDVANSFVKLSLSGKLFIDIFETLYKVLFGMLLASTVGILLGIILGWYKRLERLCKLVISILRPIPPIAWIPFSIIWFGLGIGPAVFIIFMGCVFPILISTIDGVHRTDPVLIEAAQSFGASDRQMLTEVIIPSSLPFIVSGLKVAIGIALMCTISGEMIGSSSGIGYMILTSTNLFDTGSTVVGMLVIGVIGIIFDYIFTKIQERIFW